MKKLKAWLLQLDVEAFFGILIVILLVMLISGLLVGRACTTPIILEPVETGIDAGALENDAREKALEAEQRAEDRIRELEEEYRGKMENWDIDQAREYEKVKKEGPDAVADWLTDFNRSLVE